MTYFISWPTTDENFHWLTGQISYLIAAAIVVRTGWLRRQGSSWIPDENAVPKLLTFIATPIIAIILSLQYELLGKPVDIKPLAGLTSVFLVTAVLALLYTRYLINCYGVLVKSKSLFLGRDITVTRIGGSELREEAMNIQKATDKSINSLVADSGYDLELVFTRASLARVYFLVQASYLTFEVCGPMALCGAGMLLNKT